MTRTKPICSARARHTRLRHGVAALLVLAASSGSAGSAAALGPVNATVGYTFHSGPAGQTTWSPMAELGSDLKVCSMSAGVSHIDDNQIGKAWSVDGALKFPLALGTHLDLSGTGFMGDSMSGVWSLKAGPEFGLGKDRTLGFFFEHSNDNLNASASALGAELDTPVVPKLSSSLGAFVQRSEGITGADAAVGLSWNAVDALEITAEAGESLNGTQLSGIVPRRQLRKRQTRGGATTTSVGSAAATTFQVGVRINF